MRTLFLYITSPTPQWWCLRIRREYFTAALTIRTALNGAPIHQSEFSELFLHGRSNSPIAVKRIQAQKEADYFRRYFWCQGKREFYGSEKLLKNGLHCPEPIGYAFNLFPLSHFDALYLSAYLPGALPATRWLQGKTPAERQQILIAAAKDLAALFQKNLFHKDAHLGNVLISEKSNQLHWIDNDLMPFPSSQREIYRERLLDRFFAKSNMESPEERQIFLDHFR